MTNATEACTTEALSRKAERRVGGSSRRSLVAEAFRESRVERSRRWYGWRRVLAIGGGLGSVIMTGMVTGCFLDGLLNSDQLPAGVNDPGITKTATGARNAYNGTIAAFRAAFGGATGDGDGSESVVAQTALLTDELRYTVVSLGQEVDQRVLPEDANSSAGSATYAALQKVRNQARQAIGLIRDYLPVDSALAGRLYALQGYTELFLADLYCSGIPLSTLDYNGNYTNRPGSSTSEVLTQAVALFDTAVSLSADSVRFADLARVGRGRALLELGNYVAAAAAVAPVADAYHYAVPYNAVSTGTIAALNFARVKSGSHWAFSTADFEGVNGLDWRTSRDPRLAFMVDSARLNEFSPYYYIYHPTKYAVTGDSAIVLANGIEARLIEAEAALQAGGDWLAKLNALRTDGTFATQPTADPNDDPAAVDTIWHRGSGGVDSLAPLVDPGTVRGRVDLLFRERAFWLYLTGHRQGDLRRLIRQYGRQQDNVYPVGTYGTSGLNTLLYGSSVEIPAPEKNNPLYTGCASRGA